MSATEGADAPVEVNAKGFPTMPDELLLEIMSHCPKPRDVISTEATEDRAEDAMVYAMRRDMLLALSQTCRNLRRFFRPYVWSRIEVCRGMLDESPADGLGGKIHVAEVRQMYNEELVRQLEIVTERDPSLAEHVKLINVEVMNSRIASVLAELARCMALLPNLRVVKLAISPSTSWSDNFYKYAKKAFSRYSYPQVEVAILSRAAYPLLLSCPSVRSVDRTGNKYSYQRSHIERDFWDCVEGFCPKLESLTVDMAAGNSEEIVRILPNLRQITLRFTSYINRENQVVPHTYANLEKLQHLRSIKIETSDSFDFWARKRAVDWAVRVLLKLQQEDKEDKEVILRYQQHSGYWRHITEYKMETTHLPAPKPS
ncbi:hypothetical protein GALMADRAFT_245602 [Galerina marginata CBS 339.88]|uniref:F-box domain-containing protein n=1 Tax=Galerina marginata (strain CBS 339.88) TaxID=685588 RepID=A0A067TBZ9_GALM3|nr:hypothetical protein GALMADRAFT_245602 [Galerina marginata CBS 339.88]